MSPILNYTTQIEVARTSYEVMGILAAYGATAIMATYDGQGNVTGLSFSIETSQGHLQFRVPVNADATLRVLERERWKKLVAPRYVTKEQAKRVAWRIIKDWVEAQMALVKLEMVRMEEVFLPYLLGPKGSTLYESMVEAGSLPALPPGREERKEI